MTLREAAGYGLIGRMGETPENYIQRLNYELDVIEEMGYESYFLVLADLMQKGMEKGLIFGPGRGSAGGSLVAYALKITDLDPIAHGLLFERFLNPKRKSLPDIDIDINESQRGNFIDIVRETYGQDHVALIGTVGTIGAKAALKDACRVLGHPPSVGAERSGMLPLAKFGRAPDLSAYTGPKDEIYQLAKKFEGKVRNAGQHAAGVVISPLDLTELLPLWRPAGQETWVTGLDMHEVSELGFVKYDFLGLRNLGVIDDTLKMIGGSWRALPTFPDDCNDTKTYELLASGSSLGIFQLDSPGMQGLLRLLKPTTFNDISSVLALFRPGPMGMKAHTEFAHRKNRTGGWHHEWAIHSELEEACQAALGSTFGLIVFQEQVLQMLSLVCGWSYAESALLFDAMRKKNHEKMEAIRPDFFSSGGEKYSEEALVALWDVLVPFADYSFNRAHTAGYGLIAYWTAYLKANYPVEYMSALLSTVTDKPEKFGEYLDECARMGIILTTPDINKSDVGFTPDSPTIRYGLEAIKGIGESVVEMLKAGRPWRSLDDLLRRSPKEVANLRVLSALTLSGALDSIIGGDREGVELALPDLLERASGIRAKNLIGQPEIFDVPFSFLPGSHSLSGRREAEQELLGRSVSVEGLVITLNRPLQVEETEILRDLMRAHPGRSPVVVKVREVRLEMPPVSYTQKLVTAIEALPGVKVVVS